MIRKKNYHCKTAAQKRDQGTITKRLKPQINVYLIKQELYCPHQHTFMSVLMFLVWLRVMFYMFFITFVTFMIVGSQRKPLHVSVYFLLL